MAPWAKTSYIEMAALPPLRGAERRQALGATNLVRYRRDRNAPHEGRLAVGPTSKRKSCWDAKVGNVWENPATATVEEQGQRRSHNGRREFRWSRLSESN